MADPIVFSTEDDGAVHVDKLNGFGVQVAGALDGIEAIDQAVLDTQNNRDAAALSAGDASDSAGAAAVDRAGAEEARDEAQYISDTILYQIDNQRTLANVARYGVDQPHPGMDNQFAGAAMLDPRWEFSRPGEGYVTGPAGLLVPRAANVPRFQYNALTGAPEGLLIEPQSTNIVPRSTRLDMWSRASATNNPLPDWRGWPVTRVENSTGGNAAARVNTATSETPAGSRVACSVIARPMADGVISIAHGGGTWAVSPAGVLRTDIWATAANAQILQFTPLGDGFIYVQVAYDVGTTDLTSVYAFADRSSGVIGRYCDYALVQIERAPAASSPIVTGAEVVTRPADSMYLDMQLVPGFSPTRGSIVVEWLELANIGQPVALSSSSSTLGGALYLSRSSGGTTPRLSIGVGGVTQSINLGGAVETNVVNRAAIRFDRGSVAASLNGRPVVHLTHSSGFPGGLRYLLVGANSHGTFRRAPWYPFPLSDAQLVALSTV